MLNFRVGGTEPSRQGCDTLSCEHLGYFPLRLQSIKNMPARWRNRFAFVGVCVGSESVTDCSGELQQGGRWQNKSAASLQAAGLDPAEELGPLEAVGATACLRRVCLLGIESAPPSTS